MMSVARTKQSSRSVGRGKGPCTRGGVGKVNRFLLTLSLDDGNLIHQTVGASKVTLGEFGKQFSHQKTPVQLHDHITHKARNWRLLRVNTGNNLKDRVKKGGNLPSQAPP